MTSVDSSPSTPSTAGGSSSAPAPTSADAPARGSNASLLLSTILSRVQLIKNLQSDNKFEDKIAEGFIKATPKNRIEKVAEIIKEFKDNENSGGLRYYAISLVNGLERIIYEKWKKDLNNEDLKFILGEFKSSRDFLSTPGASVKMILEHLALVL